jgi:predicted membrane-bound dolichyl-phosphate-mannose-protein mannosyltransferase
MSEPNLLLSLLPFLLVTLIVALFAIPIIRRKGKSIGYFFLCLIRFITAFVLIYLASLTDKDVLDRLAALEGKANR